MNFKLFILYLFVFLKCSSIFSFESQDSIYYFYDKTNSLNQSQVESKEFNVYEEKISDGANTGTYWFKLIKFKSSETQSLLKIETLSKNIKIYNSSSFLRLNNYSPFTSIRFDCDDNRCEYLIKVVCPKQASLELELLPENELSQQENSKIFRIGLYFGIVFIIILLNLFYYLNIKDPIFLLYAITLLAINGCVWLADTASYLFTVNDSLINGIEIIFHFVTPVIVFWFATKYVGVHKYFPKYKFVGVITIAIGWFFLALYQFSSDFLFFAISDFFAMTVMLVSWFAAILMLKKNVYSKFLAVGYFFMLILSFDYFVAPKFGVEFLNVSPAQLKLAGFFEMMIMSYAVVFRMRVLDSENRDLKISVLNFMNQLENLKKESGKTSEQSLKEKGLTEREIEVVFLIQKGLTNDKVSKALFVSINTVKFHIKNIYAKLDIKNRSEINEKII